MYDNKFTINRKFTPMPAPKSASANLKEGIISFAIIMILYYLIMAVWNILVAPFRAIFETESTKLARDIKIAKDKKGSRDAKLFYQRGIAYTDDNFNRILNPIECDELDTELVGVPNVYLQDCLKENHINGAFLDYFKNQVELHQTCPWGRRHRFLMTIRNFYPEFTPKFSVIPSEIEALREDAKAGEAVNELQAEMMKKGVKDYIAVSIIRDFGNDPEAFKKELADWASYEERWRNK
jgi:hypothetical protein